MNRHYIELMNNIRNDAYKLGYIEGTKQADFENEKKTEQLKKELLIQQQRVSWFQDKYSRMQENYKNQIENLQSKINHLEELERRC